MTHRHINKIVGTEAWPSSTIPPGGWARWPQHARHDGKQNAANPVEFFEGAT